MGGNLDAYRAKRDPARTPEPFGDPRRGSSRLFVVQKHAARRLHYDLRLEIGGTLKSWAVPKGPSVRHGERRLAVHVEDHPIEYADFEGVIPRGSYGAGEVIVWDRGWFRSPKPESLDEQLARGRVEVELFGVKLRGLWTLVRTAAGRDWLLLKNADTYADREEPTERFPESILSGLTVEELRQGPVRLARLRRRLASLRVPARRISASDQPVMLATLAAKPFSREGWLFEVKYDGVRVLAERDGSTVELYGRAGQRFTERYPEVVSALRALPLDHVLLDGEVVALDERGRPSFQRLQSRMHLTRGADVERARATTPVTAVFFDALSLDGRDLRALPLETRKECLELVVPARGVIQLGAHVAEHGEAFYEAASEQRVEGIVAKRAASAYTAGRSADWIKIKCHLRQEFVIGGFTAPQGTRARFGALHVGVYEDADLVYVGRVGTGFDDDTLDRIWARLQTLRCARSPFTRGRPTGRGHTWVEPALVCEVRFAEWTADGGIRHPAFLGLREDKRAVECRREVAVGAVGAGGPEGSPTPAMVRAVRRRVFPSTRGAQIPSHGHGSVEPSGPPAPTAPTATSAETRPTTRARGAEKRAERRSDADASLGSGNRSAARSRAASPSETGAEARRAGRSAATSAAGDARARGVDRVRTAAGSAADDDGELRLSNVGKVFWPEDGFTKGELIAYYDTVARLMLPYLKDRPLVLTRYPDGIDGKSFYQKDAPHFAPAWVRTVRVESSDLERAIDYLVVDDARTLRWVVNLGAIPLHLWGARVGSLERPDWLVLDLDPKGAPFTDVVRVALALRAILDDLEIDSYVKTSGATGLHILVPLGTRYSWDETRTFARLLATLGMEAEPAIATMARPLRARAGKVYIDWLQNVQGQTIVAPFSVRPLPGAPASCPLTWDEVTPALDPRAFSILTVPARFARMKDPCAPVLRGAIDIAAALARLQRRVSAARGRRVR